MRKLLGILAAGALLFGTVGTAHAKIIGFHGTVGVSLGALPPINATGAGLAILNNSNGGVKGAIHLNTMQILTNTVFGSATVPVSDPDVAPLVSLRG